MVDICQFLYWNQDQIHSFEDYSLILPDISIGNVGQLAIDLLLNNMNVDHLGRILHPCFLPFIGGNPFDFKSKRLESSCEIYECKEKKLVFLQMRSCVFRSRYSEFKDLLLNFLKSLNFKRTIILASSSSEYFPAEQLRGIPLHYLSTSKFSNNKELEHLKMKEFSMPNAEYAKDHISGSFVSHSLLQECEKESLEFVALICICSEGDNYPEAFNMVNCVNMWLKLKQVNESEETWKIPSSWRLPYGSAAPPEMY